mmetsp:Transcript_2491/g.3957  ORF Transcript_2491/g.3957 Transcript_2491/m.3957 type:complete len:87 (-) Transcript_2491:228-488(-)
MPVELGATLSLDWWLDRADFYDTEMMPGIVYFESWEHLEDLLSPVGGTPPIPIASPSITHLKEREESIMAAWKALLHIPPFCDLSI